jgi:DnaJ-class molecular chaperone
VRTILVVVVVVVVGLVILGLVDRRREGRRDAGWRIDRTARVVCKACHGSGWISPKRRTLEFGPEGFADQQGPAEPCSACRGTGVIARK